MVFLYLTKKVQAEMLLRVISFSGGVEGSFGVAFFLVV